MITTYRPCAGVMLLSRNGLVWSGHRVGAQDYWQFPQGGIDDGEDPLEAAHRELTEETGIPRSEVHLLGEHPNWLVYDLPPELVGVALKGKYRGQRQRWFVMRLIGNDTSVNLNAHHNPEFDSWRWSTYEEALAHVIPFKRTIYEQLAPTFQRLKLLP